MKDRQPDYYLCSIRDLEDAIRDLNDDSVRYVVSLRMAGGINVYGLPTKLETAKEQIGDITSAMENDEIIQVGHTVINTKNICTLRLVKYIRGDVDDDYQS